MRKSVMLTCLLFMAIHMPLARGVDFGPYYVQLNSSSVCYMAYVTEENLLFGFVFYSAENYYPMTGTLGSRSATVHSYYEADDGYNYSILDVFDLSTLNADFYFFDPDKGLRYYGSDSSSLVDSCWGY